MLSYRGPIGAQFTSCQEAKSSSRKGCVCITLLSFVPLQI